MVKKSRYGSDDEISTHVLPTVVDDPYVEQVGSTLTCTMGNWDGEPTDHVYQWQLDGADVASTGSSLTIKPEDVGKTATCILTVSNAEGSGEATSNAVVIADMGFPAVPVNLDEPKTYRVLDDNTSIEIEGVKTVFNKDDEAQVSINKAREAIAQGARIIGID